MTEQVLPRLVYIGDAPIEMSFHGSLLLHRLLEDYPKDSLLVIEGLLGVSQTEKRLPDVQYHALKNARPRLLNTRFHRYASAWFAFTARFRLRKIDSLTDNFSPQAVLTVVHGYSWLTAAAYARKKKIPLHLIIHDDWPRVSGLKPSLAKWFDRALSVVYREAKSRLCISRNMVRDYAERYQAEGMVLPPIRSKASVTDILDSNAKHKFDGSIKLAFAGSINSPGYVDILKAVGTAVNKLGGELLIYGPVSEAAAEHSGLMVPGIRLQGLLAPEELMRQLLFNADVLLLPMSFTDVDRSNMKLGFPSKLADYTLAKLPILIIGPEYCSAVQWAMENQGVAEIVTSLDSKMISAALIRLNSNSDYRSQLACNAVDKGNETFSHAVTFNLFCDALRSHVPPKHEQENYKRGANLP